ncbi:Olfactory receptor 2AG1 [Lemmus lemmus]
MYLLLGQLSLIDFFLTSIVIPKAVMDFLLKDNTISFGGCALQMFLALTLGGAEDLLLAFMAYDRYVAICHPLNYMIYMRPRICWLGIATSWILGFLSALGYTIHTMQYPFCKSRKIRDLFCEIPPLLKLACADTSTYELMVFLFAVLNKPSNEGRKKALVTCSSHLTVVGLYYGALTVMFVLPSSYLTPKQENILSVFYTVVTPALNPLIYSLRNKEVTGALRRVLGKWLLHPESTF